MADASNLATLAPPRAATPKPVVPGWRFHELGLLGLVAAAQLVWFGALLYYAVRLVG
jgi:hypothetical protein